MVLGILGYRRRLYQALNCNMDNADISISRKHPIDPIFSLDMLASKIYVVASPSLMYAVQRNNKIISFDPLFTTVAKHLAGIQGNALNMIREVESGGHGLGREIMNAMIPTLTGKSLDKMNDQILRSLRPLLDELDGIQTFDLYGWCRYAITVASTDAKYGQLNPYKVPATADAFWYVYGNQIRPADSILIKLTGASNRTSAYCWQIFSLGLRLERPGRVVSRSHML